MLSRLKAALFLEQKSEYASSTTTIPRNQPARSIMSSSLKAFPVGLLGEQRKMTLVERSTAFFKASTSREKSFFSRTSLNSTLLVSAATRYIP